MRRHRLPGTEAIVGGVEMLTRPGLGGPFVDAGQARFAHSGALAAKGGAFLCEQRHF